MVSSIYLDFYLKHYVYIDSIQLGVILVQNQRLKMGLKKQSTRTNMTFMCPCIVIQL
jgi:hypothetical protein